MGPVSIAAPRLKKVAPPTPLRFLRVPYENLLWAREIQRYRSRSVSSIRYRYRYRYCIRYFGTWKYVPPVVPKYRKRYRFSFSIPSTALCTHAYVISGRKPIHRALNMNLIFNMTLKIKMNVIFMFIVVNLIVRTRFEYWLPGMEVSGFEGNLDLSLNASLNTSLTVGGIQDSFTGI